MVAIGIDLGTTNTVVSVWKDDKVIIIPNDEGLRVTPSIVAFTDTDMLVGDVAKHQMAMNPENTVFEVKRMIGQKLSNPGLQSSMKLFPFTIANDGQDNPMIKVMFHNESTTFAPEQISSFMLRKMKTLAETFLREPVTDAVITVPAYFNNNQRQATTDAAKLAGLKVLRIIHEPTAAALAFGLEFKPKGTNNVVIFDLGGGTFDVSVLKIMEGSAFDVLAVAGDTHLGGVDFTNILVQRCVDEFKRIHNFDLFKNKRAICRLQKACERAKITLSQSEKVSIDLDCILNGLDLMVKVERGEFELMCRQLAEKAMECLRSALADAKLKPAEIDEILLVGGSTRIPKIRTLLQNFFGGKVLNSAVHPDEAVAYGAAIQAAIMSGAFCNSFGQLKDVTPLSLGISISLEKLMSVIVGRNTKIPHTNKLRYSTCYDFQTSVRISVYEGERPFVADNLLLSEFHLKNLTPAKAGVNALDVQFALDENGILIVTATEVGNANTASIRIDNISGRLPKGIIDKMMRDAEKYREFDDERVVCVALRQQMTNYISDCFDELAQVENMEDNTIEEVARECALESKWLKSNPLAAKSEVQDRFDRLRTVMKTKLKPKNRSSKLSKIYQAFRAALQNTDEGNAPSTSAASRSADGVIVKEEPADAEIIDVD